MVKVTNPPKKTEKKRRLSSKIIYTVILVVVIVFGAFYFVRYMQVNNKYKDISMSQDAKNQKTLSQIGKLMELPKDEKPSDISIVNDKSKLTSNEKAKAFYTNAEKNDIVVAYKNANLSIIYRPSQKKIIKTDNYTNFFAATYSINVAILAPTDKQAETETLIASKVLNINIVSKQVPKTSPASSYVADVSGTNSKAAKELADKLGLPVGQLPDGESKPEGASLVVVIGTQPPTTP